MSEQLHQNHEHDPEPQKVHEAHKEKPEAQHEKPVEVKSAQSVEKLRHTAEKQAVSVEKIKEQQQHDQEKDETPVYAPNKDLKNHALNQTLQRVRRKLPRSERQFSRFIHNPVVEQISDITSATVARPGGLLVGGLFSLLSSFGLLIACYYYGYDYNFLLALIFFGWGFIAGLAIEAVVRLAKR